MKSLRQAFWILTVIFSLVLAISCHKADVSGPEQESKQAEELQLLRETPKCPSLLWISIDTWRWDYIGLSGQGRVETPMLDRLGREGLYEAEVVTPCPLTTPAHASMFTALNPLGHRVFDCVQYSLDQRMVTIAELFRQHQYMTAAFVSAETMSSRFGLDQGFDHYNQSGIARYGRNEWLSASKDGQETTGAVLDYLKKQSPDTPLFVFVHYYDLHIPYRPRPEYDPVYPTDPYASQAAYVDAQVRRLWQYLETDRQRSWKILIVGDHGEGHGDHDEIGHGYLLYRSTRHVPMIMYPKPERELVRARPWGLIDLAPTVADWFGLPKLAEVDGVDLFKEGPERSLACLTLLPTFMFAVNPGLGIQTGKYMYMKHGTEELYDLSLDGAERSDLSRNSAYQDILTELHHACQKEFPLDQIERLVSPTLTSSSDELARLQSLGYVSGTISEMNDNQKVDLRELVRDYNRMAKVQTDYSMHQQAAWAEFKDTYRTIMAKYPRSVRIHRNYSKMLLKVGELDEAKTILEKIVELDARDVSSLTNLGALYLKQGSSERAQELLETAVKLDDSYALAHKNLAILYGEVRQEHLKSVEHYKRYLELVPNAPEYRSIQTYIQAVETQLGHTDSK
ncbi:sulfatase-like hydrolase/transferase [bacterium]|nr:sulfatase-like hydrolase/transferase [bacterium]